MADKDKPYAVRLRAEELDRIEVVQARIEAKVKAGGDVTLTAIGKTSRAAVMRLALLRGLAELEREYSLKDT